MYFVFPTSITIRNVGETSLKIEVSIFNGTPIYMTVFPINIDLIY